MKGTKPHRNSLEVSGEDSVLSLWRAQFQSLLQELTSKPHSAGKKNFFKLKQEKHVKIQYPFMIKTTQQTSNRNYTIGKTIPPKNYMMNIMLK